MRGFGLSLVNDELKKELIYMAITESETAWEIRRKGKRYKPISVKNSEIIEKAYQREIVKRKVSGDAATSVISLANGLKVNWGDLDRIEMLEPQNGVLRRSSAPGFSATISMGEFTTQAHLKLNRLQIDNQMPGCLFPIIMCPVTPPKSLAQDLAPKAFIECSVVLQRISNMNRFKYLSVLIQEFLIQIDGQFLMALAEFAGQTTTTETDYRELIKQDMDLITKDEEVAETSEIVFQKNYFDLFHFSPLKVHVSFSLGGVSSWELFGIFDLLLRSAGVTLSKELTCL